MRLSNWHFVLILAQYRLGVPVAVRESAVGGPVVWNSMLPGSAGAVGRWRQKEQIEATAIG